MRGDSRRDLYAKTLALCGLGVLACTGAVVDYWPVGVRFPSVAPLFDVAPSGALPVPSAVMTEAAPVESSFEPRIAIASLRTERAADVDDAAPIVTRDAAAPTEIAHTDFANAAFAISEDDTVTAVPLAASAFVRVSNELPVMPTALLDVPGGPADAPRVMASAIPTLGTGDGDQDGFLTGAFKRTGSSIVKTGAKTGGSIFDAVRVVGSAFRRAWPD